MTLRTGSRLAATLLGALMSAAAGSALAHHSLAGQFDLKNAVTLTGVISKVDWINPHIYIHLDVTDTDGKVATWRLECVPVAMARKAGLTKAMLLGDGETVIVEAYPARNGTPQLGFILKITYPDGRYFQFTADTRETA